jgi:uroporphyrinogen decarboxylase
MGQSPFTHPVTPDWEAFVRCIGRKGTPRRVHLVELFLDEEIKQIICARYGLLDRLDPDDPFLPQKREVALQRFLGYDYVVAGPEGLDMPMNLHPVEDTAAAKRAGGRQYMDEHRGPITTWAEFDAYPWPDPGAASTRALEWYHEHLPDDMCIIGGLTGHFAENLTWLMGYETLCLSLYDQRDLVQAIADRCLELDRQVVARLLEFERVRLIWGSDDMGFRSGPLISPKDMRALVLPGHRALAQLAHDAGRPYLLHSCGNLAAIMEDLIEEVKIDARHSFEDTILDVREAKRLWGDRIALLGGIDLDFLCRADEEGVRQRVRETLEVCQPGGGYCLGTGNSVANYGPVENYLALVDEGRRFVMRDT